ncbi:MAG: GNAT family N-acetyltransferase [Bacteroidota bacterium]
MNIRKATEKDYDAVWEIFHEVIQGGDTYVFLPDTPKEDLATHWFGESYHTFVVEDNDHIVGTYLLKPNEIGRGSHVANCGYMVKSNAHGRGIGSLMCEHSIEKARELAFKAIQFNKVVSTNQRAIRLWEKYGFQIIGTIPNGFDHKEFGYVDAYMMYKEL